MPRNQCELLTIYLESTGKNVYHDAEEEKIIKPSIINDNSDKNKSRKRLSLKFLETKCLGLIKKNHKGSVVFEFLKIIFFRTLFRPKFSFEMLVLVMPSLNFGQKVFGHKISMSRQSL